MVTCEGNFFGYSITTLLRAISDIIILFLASLLAMELNCYVLETSMDLLIHVSWSLVACM